MFIVVPNLKVIHFVTFSVLVPAVSHSASLRLNISKRKTGKKKADKQRGL